MFVILAANWLQIMGRLIVKLAQSIRRSLWVREVLSLSPFSTNALVKLSVLEITLDKEPTANCLAETHTKLEELILARIAECGLNRVQLPCHCRVPI